MTANSMTNQFIRHYLAASIIPIILLLFLILVAVAMTRNDLEDSLRQSTRALNRDAEHGFRQLGEKIVTAKAHDVARQVEMYFRMHPGRTFSEMRRDPLFMGLAVQKVGDTGYTALCESATWRFLVHPDVKLSGTDMRMLAKALPAWWQIVREASETKVAVSGYYDWLDPTRTVRKKFMAIAPVGVKHRGIDVWVSATTYIDEFSALARKMEEKAAAAAVADDHRRRQSVQLMRFAGLSGLTLLLTLAGICLWGRRVGSRYIAPITQLAETAKRLGEGRWEAQPPDHVLTREDEIGGMAQSLFRMSQQLKETFLNLEQRVTELRQTRDALKASEEHYRSLFDGIPVGLYRSSPGGRFLDINPFLARNLGYPDRDSLLDVDARDIYFDPDDRDVWMAEMKASNGTLTCEVCLRRYDGTPIWMEDSARMVYDDSGAVLHYEGSLKDMTERRLAEAALRKSEENFRALYEESRQAQEVYRSLIHSSADAIVTCDFRGEVTYASPMFTTVFGWHTRELTGQSFPFAPEAERDPIRTAIGKVVKEGTPCQGFETRGITKKGRIIDIVLSASRYNDHEGKPAGILIVLRDISASKRMEEHLKQVERLEAIATLAGGIAHDFNNMLGAMMGYTELAKLRTTDPRIAPYLEQVLQACYRARDLVNQILTFSRRTVQEKKPLSLPPLVKEVTKFFRASLPKTIEVKLSLHAVSDAIMADATQMHQLLMNLCMNAGHAMKSNGGTLEILLEEIGITEGDMRYVALKPGRYLRLSVLDTGHGIEERNMEKIFEPYFTTKDQGEGTGLGLSVVDGIVKSHGGAIKVYSEVGKGSAFHIYLPLLDEQAIADDREKADPLPGGTERVLLVDDEEMLVQVAKLSLEELGYSVVAQTDPAQAIDLFRQDRSAFDLVITDKTMPKVTGFDLAREIRGIRPDLPIILCTGFQDQEDAERISALGIRHFVTKPVSIAVLSRTVRHALDGDEGERKSAAGQVQAIRTPKAGRARHSLQSSA